MKIEPSEKLLSQLRGLVAQKTNLERDGVLLETKFSLIIEKILREAGVSDMEADVNLNTSDWSIEVVESLKNINATD